MKKVKLLWIKFENLKTGLTIDKIEFNKDITLLVGLSGAGKTQILNVIGYSLKLATDKDVILKPYQVTLSVSIEEDIYEWTYRIENVSNEESVLEENYNFTYERLLYNGQNIFERENEKLVVAGYDKLPMPKKDESLLLQYAEDNNFKRLIIGMKKMYSVDIELAVRWGIPTEDYTKMKVKVKEVIEVKKDIEFKEFSHLPVLLKLYIAKRYYPNLFSRIFDAVNSLFNEIEDIDILEDATREIYGVAIIVYNKSLLQSDISNGMLKAIYYIVELFTMSEDSLVLIDEFENGLGVNCIDLLSEILFTERDDLQFIITSHHPKIINSISKEKWKIIDREGSVIKNVDSKSYGIGNSQHDAYFNLINRWEYEGKI
ncbi:MAG: ATP-binding protein [Clostridium sp.]|nr:ATP-binding protein [Clostridium sp.]